MKVKQLIAVFVTGILLIAAGMAWRWHRKTVPPARPPVAVCGRVN
jgi:hypothetical protein